MPLAYPLGLRTIIRQSKSRTQPAAFSAAEPRRGAAYFQATGSDTPVFWDCTFRFTRDEAVQFRLWFNVTLQRGALWFEMPIKTEFGLIDYLCHFLPEGLLNAREDGELWEYSATIIARAEIVPQAVIDTYAVSWATVPDQAGDVYDALNLDLSAYVSGGIGPYLFELEDGTLPDGITLSDDGILSGNYAAVGTLDVTFRVTAAVGGVAISNQVQFVVSSAGYSAEVLADAPVGYWRLGESVLPTAYNEIGSGADGGYVGAPTLGQASLCGEANTSAAFNGTDQNVGITDSSLVVNRNFTMECIIKPDVVTGGTLLSQGHNATAIRLNAGNVEVMRSYIGSVGVGSTTLSAGGTYHVALSVAAGAGAVAWELFINGVSDASGTFDFQLGTGAQLQIGKDYNDDFGPASSGYFDGLIDEVAFYSPAISGARILAHAQAAGL